MKIRILFTLLILGCLGGVSAQTSSGFWTPVSESGMVLSESNTRPLKPLAFKSFQADVAAMKNYLSAAPMEFTAKARENALLFAIPNPDGQLRNFRVVESPIIAPGLKAKYPELRTYAGMATDGSGDMVRLGLTYKGFHAYVFAANGELQVVCPYAEGQTTYYMAYRESDLPVNELVPPGARICSTNEHDLLDGEDPFFAAKNDYVANRDVLGAVKLRKYRVAIAAKGEYTVFHGGTVSQALSAIVVALNYIVAIQERDFNVRLELIANDDLIIWTDPATDPYTGNGADDWMNQNPGAINPVITSGSYDIGHVFGVYVQGFAIGIAGGRVCNSLNKARASSNGIPPIGEYFYKVAAHEMCHQMSGSHTWNDCSADANEQRADEGAYEPGSGSTIMSYSGACDANNNVVGESDPYFHIGSIEQVNYFVFQESGATCGTLIETDNTAPVVSIPYTDGFYIPMKTPFELTGTATDAEDTGLTYCWEEFDLGPQLMLGQAAGTSPLFRSYPPANTPTRTFPRIQTLISNLTNPREILPDYDRNITFKLTVRDNHPGAGGISTQQVKFKNTAQAGPFLVTSPNGSFVNWQVGEYQIVTWDVANTDKLPVNCQTVNIRLSLNNGSTFPITLASGVPNIGQACILVPNNVSATARIRVEAADNIFFDISNAGFKIEQPATPGFSFCTSVLESRVCLPMVFSTQVSLVGVTGFSDYVTLSAEGLPAGVTASFTQNPIQPGGNVNMYLNFPDNFPEGNYDVVVKGTAGANSQSRTITLTIVNNDYSAFHLQTPADGSNGIDKVPVLHWTSVPDANYYEVQLANSATFDAGNIVATTQSITQDSFKVPVFLEDGKAYFWRVRPVNECGPGPWSDIFAFATRVLSCNTYNANDLPKVISANSVNTIESKVTINSGGSITDLNITKIKGSHQFFKDLEFRLISPANTDVLLVKDKCSSYSGHFNFGFDDSSPSPFGCPPSQSGLAYKPTGTLTSFIGQNSTGIWTLRVKDNQISSGGQLLEFAFEVCGSVSVTAPLIINNNVLQVESGANAGIGNDLLKSESGFVPAMNLTYTLLSVPTKGDLRFNFGNVLKAGDQFTQADIDNGLLRFFDAGMGITADHFRFAVTNGQGGLVTGEFTIQPFTVGAFEPRDNVRFDLTPNPAKENVRIAFPTATESSTLITIFDAAGRKLRTFTLPAGELSTLIDVSTLTDGFYAVSVQNQQGRGVKKLIVR